MAAQHSQFPRLKIKLGGKVFNEAEDRASDAQPSGDVNQSSSSDTIDTQAGARSPTSHALSMLSKMGAGRLSRGHQLMGPLPDSWATLTNHVISQQAHQPWAVHSKPRLPSQGTSGKAQVPSRPPSKGPVKAADLPSRAVGIESDGHVPPRQPAGQGVSGQAAVPTKPVSSAVKGQGEKAKAIPNGQQKPAWGAAQPAAKATQVATARSYKRLRKSPSPSLSAEPPLPSGSPTGDGHVSDSQRAGSSHLTGLRKAGSSQPVGTLRSYLEGTSQSGNFPLPFPIGQQTAATKHPKLPSTQGATAAGAQPHPQIPSEPPMKAPSGHPMQLSAAATTTQPGPAVVPVQATARSTAAPLAAAAALSAAEPAALAAASASGPAAAPEPLPTAALTATPPAAASAATGLASSAAVPSITSAALNATSSAAAHSPAQPAASPAATSVAPLVAPSKIAAPSLLPIATGTAMSVNQSAAGLPATAAAPVQAQLPALAHTLSSSPVPAAVIPHLPHISQPMSDHLPVAPDTHRLVQTVTPGGQPSGAAGEQLGALPSAYANLPGKLKPSISMSMRPRAVAMGSKAKVPLKPAKLPIEPAQLPSDRASLPLDQQQPPVHLPSAVAAAQMPPATGDGNRQPEKQTLPTSATAAEVPPVAMAILPGPPMGAMQPAMVAGQANGLVQALPDAGSAQGRREGSSAMPMGRPEGSGILPMGRTDGGGALPMGSSAGSRGMPGSVRGTLSGLSGAKEAKHDTDMPDVPTVPTSSRDRHTLEDRQGDRRGSKSPKPSLSGRPSTSRARSSSSSSSSSSGSSSRSSSRSLSPSINKSRQRSRSRSRDRRRDNRSRDYDSTRDSNRDRGRGRDRAGGNPRQRPHNRASEDHPRDSRNSRNDRHGDFRKFPDDQSRIQDRRRDKLRDGRQVQNDRRPKGSSSQPLPGGRDERGEYPINDQGVIVSPDNIRRARDHREVKNVDGKWVKPEDTGLLDPGPRHRSPRQAKSILPPAPVKATTANVSATTEDMATAAAQKRLARNAPKISPYALGPSMSTFGNAADTVKDKSLPSVALPLPPAAASAPAVATITTSVSQDTSSRAAAAAGNGQPLPLAVTSAAPHSSDLTHIASAKPAATAQVSAASVQMPAATSEPQSTTAHMTPPADVLDSTSQEPTPDVYSPIRSPPATTLTPPSFPANATPLPAPQLNPLPPVPQPQYQPLDSNAGATPYATAEQIWQQQQAYQSYYGVTYPYSDPTYGYAYSQTQAYPVPGYGAPLSTSVEATAPHPPPGGVPPPCPPPLGPNSPPPKHPYGPAPPSSSSAPPALSQGLSGAASGPSPTMPLASSVSPSPALPGALPWAPAPSSAAAPLLAADLPGATQQNKLTLAEMRRQRLEALNDRRASKAMPKQASGQLDQLKCQKSADRALGPHDRTAESHGMPKSQGPAGWDAAHAAPSGLPSRDTSSSDSARAGQNGARAGPDKPHGRPTQSLRHAAAAGAAAKPVSKPADQVRGRLGRESPRSDTSTGAGMAPEGNSQRLAGPSRFGPGRAISRELPVEQEPKRLGKKRRFQADGGGSGSQGSRHSPGPVVSEVPAKKQKTALPTAPGTTSIGSGGLTCDTVAAAAVLYHNPRQAEMLASSPEQLASQAAELLRKAEGCERDPEGRPSGQAVQCALQACLVYLHQAAVLQERHLAVDTRLLDVLSTAIQTCELTLRMHTAACTRNPLQKLGTTLLIERLLAATLERHGRAERKVVQNARSQVKLAQLSEEGVLAGGTQGLAEASLQRVSARQTQKVPADYIRQDQWCTMGYTDRKLRLDDLNDLHDERCAKVVVLASSAMNGLKPDREDAKTRLLAFSERATGGKSVDLIYSARQVMKALYRVAPDI